MSLAGMKEKVNYWEFLGLPINSSLVAIRKSYQQKITDIETSLDNKDGKYSIGDLDRATTAYSTLIDSYKRFRHNCEIGEEDPKNMPDYVQETEECSLAEDEEFLAWLQSKIDEYYILMNGPVSAFILSNKFNWEDLNFVLLGAFVVGLRIAQVNLIDKIEIREQSEKEQPKISLVAQ